MLTSETEFTEQILRPLISVICGFPKEPDCFHFIALYGKSGKVHFCKGVFGIAVALIGGLSEPAFRLQEILLYSITQKIQLAETVPVSYTHLDVYKRQPVYCSSLTGACSVVKSSA